MALLKGALKLDSALYRLDGADTIVSFAIAPGNSENRNAGRTRSQGIELGLSYDAGPWDMRLGTTLASHRYLEYQASSTLDYSGKTMPNAPRDITTAEIGYTLAQSARVALEVVRLGEYWMNNANMVRYPGHTLFNFRANYRFAKGWETWLHVRNLCRRRLCGSGLKFILRRGCVFAQHAKHLHAGRPAQHPAGCVVYLWRQVKRH